MGRKHKRHKKDSHPAAPRPNIPLDGQLHMVRLPPPPLLPKEAAYINMTDKERLASFKLTGDAPSDEQAQANLAAWKTLSADGKRALADRNLLKLDSNFVSPFQGKPISVDGKPVQFGPDGRVTFPLAPAGGTAIEKVEAFLKGKNGKIVAGALAAAILLILVTMGTTRR